MDGRWGDVTRARDHGAAGEEGGGGVGQGVGLEEQAQGLRHREVEPVGLASRGHTRGKERE